MATRRASVVAGHVLAGSPSKQMTCCSCDGTDQSAPLEGIRVLDLSQMLAGPAAAQLLGDQGADVIKVESLDGDPQRGDDGTRISSPIFTVANRNKRAVALDLKTADGVALLKRLVTTADVFLHNFRPGVAQRLGIDYETLTQVKPDIIYVSSSGYGQDGPYSQRRVYDPMIQGTSGLPSFQANDVGRPKMMRLLIPDKLTAMTSAQAISTALAQKFRTGRGCHIQLAMLDAVVAWAWAEGFAKYTFVRPDDLTEGSGRIPEDKFMRDMIYATKDGYITCGANQQKEWIALCDALGKPEWKTDERFGTSAAREKNRWLRLDMTEAILQNIPTKDVLQALHTHQVPAAEVYHPRHKVLLDPQVQHNGLIFEYDHPFTPTGKVRNPRPAARFSGAPFALRYRAPILGEHTLEVLQELGISKQEASALAESGIVKLGKSPPEPIY